MDRKLKIILVAGARPNFMKIAPLLRAIKENNERVYPVIVHTGQHYDFNMSDSFFIDLSLPKPHYFLGVGSGTHAAQTAKIMIEFEKVLVKEKPDILIVVGDVNSTLACTVVASKIRYCVNNNQVPFVNKNCRPVIVHVEAGLRSFDRTMPEEINRIITDSLSDMMFTSELSANNNLAKEGITPDKIYFVGNVMIDALEMMRSKIEKCTIRDRIGMSGLDYGIITLHRPSNVDSTENLRRIIFGLMEISKKVNLVFPVHPRTRKKLEEGDLLNILENKANIKILDPLPYKDFMNLVFMSKFVLTDSGGLQEESTYLGIPCLTLRANTERPITVKQGSNKLVNVDSIEANVDLILSGNWEFGSVPEYWDGKTSQRIVSILLDQFDII